MKRKKAIFFLFCLVLILGVCVCVCVCVCVRACVRGRKASVFYSGNFTLSQIYKVVLSVYKVLNWPDKWFSLASVKNAL